MKKISSAVLAVILCIALSLGAFAADVTLTTVVPNIHEITVTYNEGGYVLYQDATLASGSSITVERFDDIVLSVICKPDSHVKSVTINGEDVTDDILHGKLSITDVSTNMDVVFTFEKCDEVPPHGPEDPEYDPENPDKPGDDCNHIAMHGGIYKDDEPFPNARLEIDFGEVEVTPDGKYCYKVDEIKDGYHVVTIKNPDGTLAGKTYFSVEVSETATEPTVERLPDGSQVVTVPEGTTEIFLDFVVHGNGGVNPDGTPGGNPDGTPPSDDDWTELRIGKDPEPTPPQPDDNKPEKPSKPDTPSKPDKPNKPIKNPIFPNTDAFIRENPFVVVGILISFSFFLLLFVIVRRRRKDEEEETETA